MKLSIFSLSASLLAASLSGAVFASDGELDARSRFLDTHPGSAILDIDGAISRVYGKSFSQGQTPQASAEAFLRQHADLYGLDASQFMTDANLEGFQVMPLMYDRTSGEPRFFAVYYQQGVDGVPVFRSTMTLVVRNEPGFPLVLASGRTFDVGDFRLGQAIHIPADQIGLPPSEEPSFVVYAGDDPARPSEPRLATQVVEIMGVPMQPGGYGKWLVLRDAQTNEVLHRESMIIFEDVQGTLTGWRTPGWEPDANYNPEVQTALPEAKVEILGGNSVFTGDDGTFTIPHAGVDPVTVRSTMENDALRVFNAAGGESTVDVNVTPPGPADIEQNPGQNSRVTAQVNALHHSAIIHTWQQSINPSYPGLSRSFRANVNILFPCNAFYDGTSINFFRALLGCVNSAYSTVVYHEYGHKIIDDGHPTAAGDYHEGTADAITVIISDQAIVGEGFQGQGSFIRTGTNDRQYPCAGTVHDCGEVMLGAVWKTREEMVLTDPAYQAILGDLMVNSILLRPAGIDPGVTVDFLTLDDDNGNILDGTPHYWEIDRGFGQHNLAAPDLDPFALSATPLVAGQSSTLTASGASPGKRVYFTYSVSGLGDTPVPPLDVNLGIASPRVAGSEVADANGDAAISRNVPIGTTGTNVWIQATHIHRVSNIVATTIQ